MTWGPAGGDPRQQGSRWLHNGCGAEVKTGTGILWRCAKCGPVPPSDVTAASPACDFCSDPEPEFALPCGDFRIPGLINHGSAGRWLACAACAELIRMQDWDALLNRVAQIMAAKLAGNDPGRRHAIRRTLRPVYRELRRTAGPLEPFEPERSTP